MPVLELKLMDDHTIQGLNDSLGESARSGEDLQEVPDLTVSSARRWLRLSLALVLQL